MAGDRVITAMAGFLTIESNLNKASQSSLPAFAHSTSYKHVLMCRPWTKQNLCILRSYPRHDTISEGKRCRYIKPSASVEGVCEG